MDLAVGHAKYEHARTRHAHQVLRGGSHADAIDGEVQLAGGGQGRQGAELGGARVHHAVDGQFTGERKAGLVDLKADHLGGAARGPSCRRSALPGRGR
jgi:hypothetical protein